MADLSTTYMGIPLSSPVMAAASSLSGMIDNIRKAQDAGAGALVIKSLFEEQVAYEESKLAEEQQVGAETFAESLTYFPAVTHAGPREHLMWVEKARKAVKMPLIGSINAYQPGSWVDYARQMQNTGVDGLELNFYAVQTDLGTACADIEHGLYETVQQVQGAVSIPVAVKLSPYYTSVVHMVGELDRRDVRAVVLFNRFLQPDIDVESESLRNVMTWSRPEEMRVSLRYVALLYGRVKANLCASTGIHTPEAVVKQLLAGATTVQVASSLYLHGIDYISTLNEGLSRWMDRKGYRKIADFRGKLSQKDARNLFDFERAQYVDLLLKQKS